MEVTGASFSTSHLGFRFSRFWCKPKKQKASNRAELLDTPRTQHSKSSMKFRFTRKHVEESQIATLPDSQNHHHVATGATAVVQTEVIRRGSNHVLVVKDRQPTLNGKRMQVRLSRGDERCAYAPWWSGTIKARPAQGWFASDHLRARHGVQVPTQRGARARPEEGRE